MSKRNSRYNIVEHTSLATGFIASLFGDGDDHGGVVYLDLRVSCLQVNGGHGRGFSRTGLTVEGLRSTSCELIYELRTTERTERTI